MADESLGALKALLFSFDDASLRSEWKHAYQWVMVDYYAPMDELTITFDLNHARKPTVMIPVADLVSIKVLREDRSVVVAVVIEGFLGQMNDGQLVDAIKQQSEKWFR